MNRLVVMSLYQHRTLYLCQESAGTTLSAYGARATVDLRDPLLPLIRRALAAVLDDLPKTFALDEGDLQRQDIPAIPL